MKYNTLRTWKRENHYSSTLKATKRENRNIQNIRRKNRNSNAANCNAAYKMAAPPETHQESILRTAEIGEATSSALIKFAAQYSTNHPELLNLATAFDLIAVNLRSLSTTLTTYGPKIELDDSLTIPLVARIRETFEKVAKALEEGVEAEKDYGDEWEDLERVGAVAGERFRAGVRYSNMYNHAGCVRFLRSLGGLEAAEGLVWGLEELKGHIFYLAKGVRYLGLKKKESE